MEQNSQNRRKSPRAVFPCVIKVAASDKEYVDSLVASLISGQKKLEEKDK